LVAAVLFDLDGTLHDRATGLRRFARDQAVRLKFPPADRDAFVRRFIELDADGSVWKDRVYALLRDEFDSALWPSVDVLVDDYVREFPRFAVATTGAADLLSSLLRRGIGTAIVTNGRGDLQHAVIAALGFGALIGAVVVSEDVGCSKPGRKIFDVALAALKTEATKAIMVGDNPIADMEGARGAGIYPIAFRCSPDRSIPTAETMQDVEREILKRVSNQQGNAHA
jgi:putative hydrolase of the HAD superfamily